APGAADDPVPAEATPCVVAPRAAEEFVASLVPVQDVPAALAPHRVGAATPGRDVLPGAGEDQVVPALALDRVRAAPSADHVGAGCAAQPILAARPRARARRRWLLQRV